LLAVWLLQVFMRDVRDAHLQDAKWFGPIYQQLEASGYGAMLYDLLHADLGDWHSRKLPNDTGLLDQRKRSLSLLDAWWVELVETGTLAGCDTNAAGELSSAQARRRMAHSFSFRAEAVSHTPLRSLTPGAASRECRDTNEPRQPVRCDEEASATGTLR
jgi:hypothetical protein